MEFFLGQICLFPYNFVPSGFKLCNGELLPIPEFQALYSLLSTRYGGDGRSNLALPDLRGRSPVGVGQAPGMVSTAIAENVGQQFKTLTIAEMPTHTHLVSSSGQTSTAPVTGSISVISNGSVQGDAQLNGTVQMEASTKDATASTPANGTLLATPKDPIGNDIKIYIPDSTGTLHTLGGISMSGTALTDHLPVNIASAVNHDLVANMGQIAIALDHTGGSQAFDMRSPGLGLAYCIAINGAYPTRG